MDVEHVIGRDPNGTGGSLRGTAGLDVADRAALLADEHVAVLGGGKMRI
jgi:hypothetical protein